MFPVLLRKLCHFENRLAVFFFCSDRKRRGHAQKDTSNGKVPLAKIEQRGFCMAIMSR